MALRIPDNVVFEIVEDKAVLLNLESGSYHSLNSTATRVWQLLESGTDGSSIEDTMAQEFEVDRDQLKRDIDVVLQDLIDRGLLLRDEG